MNNKINFLIYFKNLKKPSFSLDLDLGSNSNSTWFLTKDLIELFETLQKNKISFSEYVIYPNPITSLKGEESKILVSKIFIKDKGLQEEKITMMAHHYLVDPFSYFLHITPNLHNIEKVTSKVVSQGQIYIHDKHKPKSNYFSSKIE